MQIKKLKQSSCKMAQGQSNDSQSFKVPGYIPEQIKRA